MRPGGRGPLDLLRFFAAAFVVVFHYGGAAPVPLGELSPVFQRGWLATDFFILLSGYVLGRAYGGKLDRAAIPPAAFFTRRVLRVWPAHLVVLAAFGGMVLLAASVGITPPHPENYQWVEFWRQAALVHGWRHGALDGWNGPTWTLSALIVCYAVFPLLWAASRRLGAAGALAAAAAAVLGSALLVERALGESLYDLDWGLVRAIPFFAAGALLARGAGSFDLRPLHPAALLASGFVLLLLVQLPPRTALTDFLTVAAISGVVVGADAWRTRPSAWAAYAGSISFSLFLTHTLVGAVWFGAARRAAERFALEGMSLWCLWVSALLVALAAAAVFHLLVDAPLQRRLREGFRPRRAPRPAPARSG